MGFLELARLNTNGVLDQTFGQGGSLTTSFGSTAAVDALTIQSDGKIVAVGTVMDSTTGIVSFALARYLGQ